MRQRWKTGTAILGGIGALAAVVLLVNAGAGQDANQPKNKTDAKRTAPELLDLYYSARGAALVMRANCLQRRFPGQKEKYQPDLEKALTDADAWLALTPRFKGHAQMQRAYALEVSPRAARRSEAARVAIPSLRSVALPGSVDATAWDLRAAVPAVQRNTSPWATLALVMVGTFMTTLDTSIVNISLPAIARAFGTPLSGPIEWVLIVYLVVMPPLSTALPSAPGFASMRSV